MVETTKKIWRIYKISSHSSLLYSANFRGSNLQVTRSYRMHSRKIQFSRLRSKTVRCKSAVRWLTRAKTIRYRHYTLRRDFASWWRHYLLSLALHTCRHPPLLFRWKLDQSCLRIDNLPSNFICTNGRLSPAFQEARCLRDLDSAPFKTSWTVLSTHRRWPGQRAAGVVNFEIYSPSSWANRTDWSIVVDRRCCSSSLAHDPIFHYYFSRVPGEPDSGY